MVSTSMPVLLYLSLKNCASVGADNGWLMPDVSMWLYKQDSFSQLVSSGRKCIYNGHETNSRCLSRMSIWEVNVDTRHTVDRCKSHYQYSRHLK